MLKLVLASKSKVRHEILLKNNINVSDVKPGVKKDTLVATIKSHTNNVSTLLIEHIKKA